MREALPDGTPVDIALPDDDAELGVVVVPDIMGLRPLFDTLCEQLADEHGWVVAAVEPFPGAEGTDLETRFAAMSTRDDDVEIGRLRAAAARMRERAPSLRRVALIGFCQGGMYALKAAGDDAFERVVSFYGMIRIPEAWEGPGHVQPLDVVSATDTPVLALCGSVDPWTPAPDIDDLRAAGATVVVYDDCDHGFVHDPDRPTHRPVEAADAWRRCAEFLA